MGQTGLDAQKGADILGTVLDKYQSDVVYPSTSIGKSLKAVAQVKFAGLGTRVFYTQHDSFDTHANELYVHGKLLREVSEAVSAFFADLKAHDEADDVIMLLWSEFGRRVKDNGAGTDHGAGGAAFLIGEAVKGGMYGEYPSLKEDTLTIGNLTHTNDFRCTYASILERWFEVDAKRFGYAYQLAFYRAVLAQLLCLPMPVHLIAVEKREPYRCGCEEMWPQVTRHSKA